MTANNPFLPLTKTGLHRAQVAPKREGLFLSFIDHLYSDWAAHQRKIEEDCKKSPGDLGGDELIVLDEQYIKDRLGELDSKQKRNLLDFFNVQSAQFLRSLHILENLLNSIRREEYQYWGCDKKTFRKTLKLPGFEFSLQEHLQAKIKACHRVLHLLLVQVMALNPQFLKIDLEAENPLDVKTMKGSDVELIKSKALALATNEMTRIEGLKAEFKPTKVTQAPMPFWPKQDAKRLILASVLTALVVCGIFVGINCIPAVGQALSLLLAMSIVNSFLVTSFVGLGVGGLLSLGFALTHMYIAAKTHYQPQDIIEEFSFNMEIAPGHEPSEPSHYVQPSPRTAPGKMQEVSMGSVYGSDEDVPADSLDMESSETNTSSHN